MLQDKYVEKFGVQATDEFKVYSRAELAGNHTDHQNGMVLATSISPCLRAVAGLSETDTINIMSEGFEPISIQLGKNYPLSSERGTTASIVRGMAVSYKIAQGFNAYIESDIPVGAGLSSSAAFEILIGRIIEKLFNLKTDPTTLAMKAQYVENVYFGKPCGLMDQMACSFGGIVKIDFSKKPIPLVETIDYSFRDNGYTMVLVDSGSSHEDLTNLYAEIPADLRKISNYFFKDTLSEVNKRRFADALPALREYAGDRAVLRAMHVYNENFRVSEMFEFLKKNDIESYLKAVNQSGDSSWMLLQNVIPSGAKENQKLAFAINSVRFCLSGQGAARLMGGGFAGMVQAYVPNEFLDEFIIRIERILGKGSAKIVECTKY